MIRVNLLPQKRGVRVGAPPAPVGDPPCPALPGAEGGEAGCAGSDGVGASPLGYLARPRPAPERAMHDLRSDTVTRPTPGMREAMAKAEVGDDVYGEDPSVNRLQERTAALLGKPASLFFPSGTMANQAALRVHTRPGDVVFAAREAHILRAEGGAAAALSGLQIETIGRDGCFGPDEVRAALHPADVHYAPTTLLAIENTHNTAAGRVFPKDVLGAVTAAAREAGLALHCDGARLWNAAVALGEPPAALASPFDTVSVCLSKGLGAPVGSLVAPVWPPTGTKAWCRGRAIRVGFDSGAGGRPVRPGSRGIRHRAVDGWRSCNRCPTSAASASAYGRS